MNPLLGNLFTNLLKPNSYPSILKATTMCEYNAKIDSKISKMAEEHDLIHEVHTEE